jgi:hypothetical protein
MTYAKRDCHLDLFHLDSSRLFMGLKHREVVGVGIYDPENRWDMGVEDSDALLFNQCQKTFRFLLGDDELNLDRKRTGQFKKSGFVQYVMPPKPRHGFKCRAAANAEFIRLLHQPFPYEMMVMAMTLVHIKSQE